MSGRIRNSKAKHDQVSPDRSRLTHAGPEVEATTESLAAAVEAELAKAEAQLAAIAHSTGEARPYEAFDTLAFHSAADEVSPSFEYDGHCPPLPRHVRTSGVNQASTYSPPGVSTYSSSASDAYDAALANRVRVMDDALSGEAASDVAAEMEVAFRQLARMFSGDVAQQWQSAAKQLDEARAMVDELRDVLTTARHALADIKRFHDDAYRARNACNPACRKT